MPFQRSNPFPSDTVVKDSIDELPDFRETESYRLAVGMVEDFIEEFPLASSSGRAMGIRGRFGSGKTHLLFQLMRELTAAKGAHCKTIYAKTDKVDFLDLYVNYFARKFEADDLKKVVSLHLAKLLRLKSKSWTEQVSTEPEMVVAGNFEPPQIEDRRTLAQIAQDEVDQLILRDPQAVLSLVENDLLPVSGLNRDFDREIETTERKQAVDPDGGKSPALTDGPSNVSLDFFRAYSKLTDPNLGPLAVRWIQGSQLSNSERVDLGLESAGITQPGVAKEAMRFLLAAFKKADFAVVLCLDEFERFSSRGTPADINACAALLKDLAEIFQKTGHLLSVAGVNDAWNAMPPDVFARIQPSYIVEMNLTESEAKGLVDVYCQASGSSFELLFDENAFHLLCEASNYNIRRILDLSYKAYELAIEANPTSPRINQDQIERAANYVLSNAKRRDAVGEAVQKVAADERLPVHPEFSLDGFRYDYVLGNQQNPKIIIEVTQSIFKLGELSAAREIANLSQLIRQRYPRTAFCVVIVGYSTKEVRDELAGVVDRVFSFDEDKFLTEFREFSKTASLRSSEVDDRLKNQEASYQDLLRKFDELEAGRRLELEQLKDALANLQADSLRTRESTREKRVTDKMEETLEELDELLDKEEALAFPSRFGRRQEQFSAGDKLDHVMRLIEEQGDHIQRAKVLNERSPRGEKEFLEELKELEFFTKRAAEFWFSGRDELSSSGEARDLFRRRRRVLNQLQGIHFSRQPAKGFAGILQELRQNKVIVAFSLLAVIGVIALLYWFFSGWSNEKAAINYYASQVSAIQGKLRIATLDLNNPTADNSMSSIFADTVTLRAAPYGQTYVVAPLTSSAIPDIQDALLRVNALVRVSARNPDGSFPDSLQPAIVAVDQLCAKLQSELAAISFGTFVRRFFSYHYFFISGCLLPSLVLLALLLRKRSRRLSLRRI